MYRCILPRKCGLFFFFRLKFHNNTFFLLYFVGCLTSYDKALTYSLHPRDEGWRGGSEGSKLSDEVCRVVRERLKDKRGRERKKVREMRNKGRERRGEKRGRYKRNKKEMREEAEEENMKIEEWKKVFCIWDWEREREGGRKTEKRERGEKVIELGWEKGWHREKKWRRWYEGGRWKVWIEEKHGMEDLRERKRKWRNKGISR